MYTRTTKYITFCNSLILLRKENVYSNCATHEMFIWSVSFKKYFIYIF